MLSPSSVIPATGYCHACRPHTLCHRFADGQPDVLTYATEVLAAPVRISGALGRRIMVQLQLALFPLYDRNPQTFVPNIFFAKPGDYRKATQTVMHTGSQASAIWLPLVPPS